MSVRKQVPISLPSSGVRNGESRVFVRPAPGALAMMAMAQRSRRSPPFVFLFTSISTRPSDTGKPVVASVLPESPGEPVGHVQGRDPFGILEPELGGNPQLERIAVFRPENLVGDLERQQRLRVQGGRHVDARIVTVGAFEADILRAEVGADPLEEGAEGNAGPLPDHAPALDT